jgi:glycosyltransferase involved in cell wall biosynthesis
MIFLGNPASYHLQTWRQIYALCGETTDELRSVHLRCGSTGGSLLPLSGPLSYAALGLRLRSLPAHATLHAHGASGYGLAALISGRRYITTIYGSEILRPHGMAYRAMVKAVLRGATAITVTSAAARHCLRTIDPMLMEKTYVFHTGIDTREIVALKSREPGIDDDKLRFMHLRNTAAPYRTLEIVEALSRFISDAPEYEIIIPLGNGDFQYFEQIKSAFPASNFRFIDHPLNHSDYLKLMAQTDICLNFPISDQVSSTLIEALFLDRIVVTNRLAAYADLLDLVDHTGDWIVADAEGGLDLAIARAVDRARTRGIVSGAGRRIVSDHFSIENAAQAFRPVLERLL